jgi:hypothetical protein
MRPKKETKKSTRGVHGSGRADHVVNDYRAASGHVADDAADLDSRAG